MPSAVGAFKAAREIPWGKKAVWVEDWILDQGPEASWISASNLAERLGMSKDNVEEHRRWLRDHGFYFIVRRVGALSDGWIPILPPVCRHRGTSVRDKQDTAHRIDAYLRGELESIDSGGAGAATDGRVYAATTKAPEGGGHPANHGGVEYANRGGATSRRGEKEGGSLGPVHISKALEPLIDRSREARGNTGRGSARARRPTRDEPLTPEELRDFRDGVERDVRTGRITRAQGDLMLRMAI